MKPGFSESITSNKIETTMKLRLLVRNTLAAFAVAGVLTTFTGRAIAQIPTPQLTKASNLHLALSTGGYKVVSPPAPAAAGPAVIASPGFPATAALYNRSATDITFTFPDAASAQRKFTFRVFDKAGVLVWQSDADVVGAQALTDAKLAKGTRWSRTAMIPLKPGGTALTPGIYSLEAVVDADKKPGAVTIFEVAAAPDPTQEQGINGLVLKPNPPEAANPLPAEIPAAGALVSVYEVRTKEAALTHVPFVWIGRTDAAGKFTVKTPAGHFRVTATLLPAVQTPPAANAGIVLPVTKTVDVTVDAGKYSEVTIHLPAAPQPPVIQGIRGLVLYGPITPVAIVGVPNEAPAAGARVVIDEILPDPNPTARAAFHWVGVTNIEGRFDAKTPAGKFKVTSTLAVVGPPAAGNAAAVAAPSASAEVIVAAGVISDVTLHIDTGLR